MLRIAVLSFIAIYSLTAIYSNSRLIFGQQLQLQVAQHSDRQTYEAERSAEMRAKIRSLEESVREVKADKLNERVSVLESGVKTTEASIRQLTEDLASLSKTANAILLGMVAFLIKEIIDLVKKKTHV